MVVFEELKFGDKVYVVNEQNNIMKKKRIVMTDSDGVEWYRYDRDHWEYEIQELEYTGKVTYMEEGEVRFDEDRVNEYHFKHPCGHTYPENEGEDEYFLNNWFNTEEEAEDHITILKAQRKGIEE